MTAVVLMVRHAGELSPIQTAPHWEFADFQKKVRGKISCSSNEEFIFKYDIDEHTNCGLNSEDDWVVFIMLCELFAKKIVKVQCVRGCHMDIQRKKQNENSFPILQNSDTRTEPAFDLNHTLQEETLYHTPFPTPKTPNNSLLFSYSGVNMVSVSINPGPKKKNTTKHKVPEPFFPGAQSTIPVYNVSPVQKQITLLSSSWVYNITHIGQEFLGGVVEFRAKLVKFAAKVGFRFKYKRNDSTYVVATCVEKYSLDCTWYVNGSLHPVTRTFFIKAGNLKHTCPPRVARNDTKRLGCRIIGDLIQESIGANPTVSPTKVQTELHVNYGFVFNYDKVWRGVEVARANIFGSYQDSFHELNWYCEAVKKTNPGSQVFLECEQQTNRFQRFFVAFHACIEGFKSCRPMLFVDGTFMKTRYKGTLLSATAKDGNNGLFPVAFAIVDQENGPNWTWFIRKLTELIHHQQEVMYISDRACGLMTAFSQVFEKPCHFFCLYHLMKNLKTMYKGKKYSDIFKNYMCKLLKDVAYAPNMRLFDEALNCFKEKGGAVALHFLNDLPYEKWAVAFSPDVIRYGELTSNAAESFNNWILEARCLPVTYMVDCIRTHIMGWFVERRENAATWTGALTARIEDIWNLDNELSSTWNILKTPNSCYEVLSDPSVIVNLQAHTCTCFKWQIQGFPCEHAIAIISRERSDLRGLVDPCFFVSTYKKCYQTDIHAVPTTEKCEFRRRNQEPTILPPAMKRLPGRPKIKRYKPKVESTNRKFLCGRCGKYGNHYWTTCKDAID